MSFRKVDANLRSTLCLLASQQDRGEIVELDSLTLASAGVRFSMFNAALVSAPVRTCGAGFRRALAAAAEHFESRGLGWSMWACEAWVGHEGVAAVAGELSRHRLVPAAAYIGMITNELAPPTGLPPLECRLVSDYVTRLDFCNIGCTCFHLPFQWFREIFDHDRMWASGLAAWVGYWEDEPVTTAATVVDGDVIGIYNVATLPQFRKRGYGEAVVRHAVEQTRQVSGAKPLVLQSTAQGRGLYLNLGFEPVTRFYIYATP